MTQSARSPGASGSRSAIGNRPADGLHDHVADVLRQAEQRYTTGRRRLVTVLARARRPLTLPEILAAEPDLAQSSAYRNLDVLERSGVIRRITLSGDHAYFELAEALLGHHHHLVCVECGAIEDIHLDAKLERLLDDALAAAAEEASYKALHHSLDLHGHCGTCQRGQ